MLNFKSAQNHIKKQSIKAFTLVEILIYMLLFLGFLTILSALFISILDTQLNSSTSSQIDQDSWYLMNRIQHDLYQASSIELPVNNGEDSDRLILNMTDSSITYSLINDKFTITENGQAYSLVNQETRVSNLNFKKLGNEDGASTITIYLELKNFAGAKTKTLNFTLGLR